MEVGPITLPLSRIISLEFMLSAMVGQVLYIDGSYVVIILGIIELVLAF